MSDIFTANDYTVVYTDNKNVGEATITVTGKNNAMGEVSYNFDILPKEIGIDWTAPADLVYDGTAKVPTATATGVVDGDSVNLTVALTSGNDNVNAGDFTYTVTALDNPNYKLPANVVSPVYTVTARLLVDADFSVDTADVTFNGSAFEPTVELLSDILTANDYTVVYTANKNVGEATITVTGKNNAQGTLVYNFDILPYVITEGDFNVDTSSRPHNGTYQEPTVELLNAILTSGDYEVVYTDNYYGGTATIYITGVNNAEGSLVYHFELTHVWDFVWSHNELGHWHACLAPDCDLAVEEMKDYEEHFGGYPTPYAKRKCNICQKGYGENLGYDKVESPVNPNEPVLPNGSGNTTDKDNVATGGTATVSVTFLMALAAYVAKKRQK